MLALHGIGGFAIVVLLPWKGAIILSAIRRRRRISLPSAGFIVLTVLLLATLATGLLWTVTGRLLIAGYSVITIHIIFAIAMLGLFTWHVVARRFIFRARSALGRRALLRLGAGSLAGLVVWRAASLTGSGLRLPGAQRRFTGSYETGRLGVTFPTVSWLFDDPPPVDVDGWRLSVEGTVEQALVLTYAELEQLASDRRVTILDCTGGWYSRQEWLGVSVGRLLSLARVRSGARTAVFEAVSGYHRRFALDEARGFLLATVVGGKPLSHGHGFPVRLVAPDHRGYDWVKWVARVRVVESSWFWQPPVPLQ